MISRRMRWTDHVECTRAILNAFEISAGKSEWKRFLGMPRCRWQDNIRMDLMEIGCDNVDWMRLTEDRD
jgi:hypothetical protein